MNRRSLLAGAGAAALATGGAVLLRPDGSSLSPVGAAQAQDVMAPEIVEMAIGEADAPVEFIEYASYTCPHCARFHAEVYPLLKADYVDTGQVRFIYREVYFDRLGLWASMVARCAGPERFFGVSDLLYEGQREWTQGDPATVAENLRRIGRSVGLSDDELQACLSDGEFAQALVDRYEAFTEEHEIPGTPTFYVNGQMQGNASYAELREVLDAAIAAAG